jgi:hypothetical protein
MFQRESSVAVYYIIVNDTKEEYVDPFDFDDNINLSGILNGLHGTGIAHMLVHPASDIKYKHGYWCGDAIRILGDSDELATQNILDNYANISYYVMASIFESGTSREEIIDRASNNKKILDGLVAVNRECCLTNLNYSLNKLIEN